jgi:hypothetical protein
MCLFYCLLSCDRQCYFSVSNSPYKLSVDTGSQAFHLFLVFYHLHLYRYVDSVHPVSKGYCKGRIQEIKLFISVCSWYVIAESCKCVTNILITPQYSGLHILILFMPVSEPCLKLQNLPSYKTPPGINAWYIYKKNRVIILFSEMIVISVTYPHNFTGRKLGFL